MKYVDTLDHKPDTVVLEKLPDGTALLRLYKDAAESSTEGPEPGTEGGKQWTATCAVCKLGTDRTTETVETITAKLDDWWTYAEAWEDQQPMTVDERLDAVETVLAGIAEMMMGGTE